MKTLTVRWDDFEAAFIIGAPGSRYFVNVCNGEVEYTGHLDGDTVRERVQRRVESGDWLEIPRASTPEGMAEIAAFIEAQDDDTLKSRLRAGLAEKKALMGFNKALGTDLAARRRWSDHRMRGIHTRLLAFCRANDLVIDDPAFRDIVAALDH